MISQSPFSISFHLFLTHSIVLLPCLSEMTISGLITLCLFPSKGLQIQYPSPLPSKNESGAITSSSTDPLPGTWISCDCEGKTDTNAIMFVGRVSLPHALRLTNRTNGGIADHAMHNVQLQSSI
jgi:hypothetical protein